EGDEALSMYIVKQGTLRILSGSTILETVREGGLIGEMAIIEEHMPRSATVIAGTYCELAQIDVPRFLSLVANTPAFSITVLRVISRRLRVMNRRYRDSTRHLSGEPPSELAAAHPLGLHEQRIDRLARRHEQAVALLAAETDVGA